ncbi:MAG: nucleoside recognition domain-containing protein [Desulfocapsaceae bacterium]|nr:nucleoside recognition domain-containing protein [Desulfocapsaceae bacterium]
MLNAIWVGFFLIAFLSALYQFLVNGQQDIFALLVRAGLDNARTAFEIGLGLTGVMCLWLGIMRIGEEAGFLRILARCLSPLFARIFPDVPQGHPALASITMNMAANMMGLDNAATPMGIKAMQELQDLNTDKGRASNAQVMFLVLNASSMTLLPVTIFTYRAQMGAVNPTDVFVPILIATYCSTLAGFILVSLTQHIRLDRVVLSWMGGLTAAVGGLTLWLMRLPPQELAQQSSLVGNLILIGLIVTFLVGAMIRRVNAYEAFIDGAKNGFQTAVTIIPYLVAMLVAIGMLRASGALDVVMDLVRWGVRGVGMDPAWVNGLPTMLIKPLSGSGARAMMVETMKTFGPDSFAGHLASIVQGSTETTFYVLSVYCGSVGIKRMRYAVAGGLVADLAGMVAAVLTAYMFFGRGS